MEASTARWTRPQRGMFGPKCTFWEEEGGRVLSLKLPQDPETREGGILQFLVPFVCLRAASPEASASLPELDLPALVANQEGSLRIPQDAHV